jgi:cytoskeletal protein CcmA (bactofilin family)
MFGKAKGDSEEKDRLLPLAPQLQNLTPASLAESASKEISCIDRGMTVVGKISSEGTLNVFGRVEGELHASIVRISNGAQVEGAITAPAVVEGEIFHRSLAIEENARFAGVSRPEEASASRVTDQLVPTDGNRQINGSLENEVHADTTTVTSN